jgi:hypothetical protein
VTKYLNWEDVGRDEHAKIFTCGKFLWENDLHLRSRTFYTATAKKHAINFTTMKVQNSGLLHQFSKLTVHSAPLRPYSISPSLLRTCNLNRPSTRLNRLFSSTPVHAGTWLLPTQPEKKRSRKGRPRVPTGGSSRGTTVVWGDYGLRMCDHHRRVSASQLKNGEDAIKQRLRGMRYRLYTRICANIGVYTSGNEVILGNILTLCPYDFR